MRDVAHGAIGALIAYAVYRLAGHAGWALAALVLYVPIYLALRDRFPRGAGAAPKIGTETQPEADMDQLGLVVIVAAVLVAAVLVCVSLAGKRH